MISFLHGFLGSPEDLPPCLGSLGEAQSLDWTPFLANQTVSTPLNSTPLAILADQLAAELPPQKSILVGYSMGGRIGLHLLVQHPQRFRAAVIISASPGLKTDRERVTRLEADLRWARRFQTEDWDQVMTDWNALPVFAGDENFHFDRSHLAKEREKWARVIDVGSVGRQADLRPALAELSIPVLFLAGENDPKYAHLTHACAELNPQFQSALIKGAGHRLPWTHPTEFMTEINRFLAKPID